MHRGFGKEHEQLGAVFRVGRIDFEESKAVTKQNTSARLGPDGIGDSRVEAAYVAGRGLDLQRAQIAATPGQQLQAAEVAVPGEIAEVHIGGRHSRSCDPTEHDERQAPPCASKLRPHGPPLC